MPRDRRCDSGSDDGSDDDDDGDDDDDDDDGDDAGRGDTPRFGRLAANNPASNATMAAASARTPANGSPKRRADNNTAGTPSSGAATRNARALDGDAPLSTR